MSESPLEPLDPELGALFEAERRFPPAEKASEARVWQAVAAAVVVPAVAGAAVLNQGKGWLAAVKAVGAGKLAAAGMAVFVAGSIAGATVQHVFIEPAQDVAPPRAPVVLPSPPVKPLEPKPTVEPLVSPAPASEPVKRLQAARPTPPAAAPVERASELAREQAIIDAARAGLTGGHHEAALAALDRHAREFPEGELSEEREGLRVLALARSGRTAEASEGASRFRQRFPRSLLLPAIQAALETGH
jgi:hypothetical protein